MTERRAN